MRGCIKVHRRCSVRNVDNRLKTGRFAPRISRRREIGMPALHHVDRGGVDDPSHMGRLGCNLDHRANLVRERLFIPIKRGEDRYMIERDEGRLGVVV